MIHEYFGDVAHLTPEAHDELIEWVKSLDVDPEAVDGRFSIVDNEFGSVLVLARFVDYPNGRPVLGILNQRVTVEMPIPVRRGSWPAGVWAHGHEPAPADAP